MAGLDVRGMPRTHILSLSYPSCQYPPQPTHPPRPMCNCIEAPKWLDTHTHLQGQAGQANNWHCGFNFHKPKCSEFNFHSPSGQSSIFTVQVVGIVCLVQSALSPQFVFLLICLTLTELFTKTLSLKRFKYILSFLNCLLKL